MASSAEQVSGHPASVSSSENTVTGQPQQQRPLRPPPASSTFYLLPASNNSSLSYSFLFRLATALLAGLVIMIAISLVLCVVFRPHLPAFHVTDASVTLLNATADEFFAALNLSVLITNPNRKLSLFYDRLEASVIYGDGILLSGTQLRHLYQNKNEQTLVRARLAVSEEHIGNDVVGGILQDKSHGLMKLTVEIIAVVRFHGGGWQTRSHFVRAFCDHLDIHFSPRSGMGVLVKSGDRCKVSLW